LEPQLGLFCSLDTDFCSLLVSPPLRMELPAQIFSRRFCLRSSFILCVLFASFLFGRATVTSVQLWLDGVAFSRCSVVVRPQKDQKHVENAPSTPLPPPLTKAFVPQSRCFLGVILGLLTFANLYSLPVSPPLKYLFEFSWGRCHTRGGGRFHLQRLFSVFEIVCFLCLLLPPSISF